MEVGNTPLIKLSDKLYAKYEALNPGGSIKDRPVKYILDDAEERGLLKRGSGQVIAEATSGNTGISLAMMCAEQNIPLIYAGSSSHHSGEYSNPYTFSKSTGEAILHMFKYNYNLKFAIARFYNVYGPNQLTEGGYTTLIGRWINNIEKDLPCEIYGDGEQRRDFTHVDDIVDGLIRINTEVAFGKTYELGRGKNYSVNEVANMFGIKPKYKPPKPGEARNTLCENKLATEMLGWIPQKDLVSYIKSYKNENKLNTTK